MQTKATTPKRTWRELASETPPLLNAEKPHHRRVFRRILRGSFEEGLVSWHALTRWNTTRRQDLD